MGEHPQAQAMARIQHHRAVEHGVRRRRSDEDPVHRRGDDGAAGGEVVGRRAGRGGDDHRVGRIADEVPALDDERHRGRSLTRRPHHHDVVEPGEPLGPDHGVEGAARLELVVAGGDGVERGGQVGDVDLGQEPEFAQVHPEHGRAGAVDEAHGSQDGAVSAQADDQVRPPGELVAGNRDGGAAQAVDLLGQAEDGDVPSSRPTEDGVDDIGRSAARVEDDPEGPDVAHRPHPRSNSRHPVHWREIAGRYGRPIARGTSNVSELRRTLTSNFGVGRRETHDASQFYARFNPGLVDDDRVTIAPHLGDGCIEGDIRKRDDRPVGSVALVVTSPPYFAGKEYDEALGKGDVPASYREFERGFARGRRCGWRGTLGTCRTMGR